MLNPLIAVTEIHRCVKPGVPADKLKGVKAQKPVTEVIIARASFVAQTPEEEEELIRIGAAVLDREAVKAGTAPVGKAAAKPATAKKTTPAKKAEAPAKAAEAPVTEPAQPEGDADGSDMV